MKKKIAGVLTTVLAASLLVGGNHPVTVQVDNMISGTQDDEDTQSDEAEAEAAEAEEEQSEEAKVAADPEDQPAATETPKEEKKAEKEKQLVDHSVDFCYFADSCWSRIFGTAKISKRSCTGKTGNDQGGSCREKLCCRKSAFRKKFPRIRNIRETASGCRYIQRVTG